MQLITILVMILIPGILWGGLLYFINLAYRKEKQKKYNG
jgi:hypothetical protein